MPRTTLKPAKAAEMLRNPPRGRPLSRKQHNYFEMVKHGGKPRKASRSGRGGY